ncbi:MAG: cell surface protein precursor [Streptococcaceae bacterium]|nr:cell surface protein precursor [Streptococcaceae bacterium]
MSKKQRKGLKRNFELHPQRSAFLKWGKTLLMMLGISLVFGVLGSLVYAANQTKSVFPAPPTDTTVTWENNKPLYYEVDQNGVEHPKPQLLLGDGITPAWCLGLGVPLLNNTTQAQHDATNQLFQKLSTEEKAVLNNVAFLGRQKGGLEGYAEAQHATYLLLDEAGVSENQSKDVIVKDNTLLQDAQKIKDGANDLIKQAKKLRELPSFNGTTIQLLQGVQKTITDTKGVLSNFPYTKNNVPGLTETILGNDLTLKADSSTSLGTYSDAIQFQNMDSGLSVNDLPYFVYSTDGDSTGKQSQSVMATTDPSRALAGLNLNIIGLGSTTLIKHDADTDSTDTQGSAQLTGSVWGLYLEGTDTLVKTTDGYKDYPITVSAGEQVNAQTLQVKLTDLLKGASIKNLDKSKDYEWGELVAPEGYELSTKRYPVHFDEHSAFDSSTSNYLSDVTATDRVLKMSFGFIKAQDVNGSLTGLSGRRFTLTPQGDTKGEVLHLTSEQAEDASGFINNGVVKTPLFAIGNYLVEEQAEDNDKLQLINPISITSTTVKDSDGKITGYTVTFTDTVTKQVITTLNVPIEKLVDNNVMFKVNLGTLVDKPVTPVLPTIRTKAHTKDGDQIIQVGEVSEKTSMVDVVDFTNVKLGDQLFSYLHRVVRDKDGKVTSDKIVQTLSFIADDETVQSQQHRFDTTADTTKDFQESNGSTVTYVFTEANFDKDANPEVDEPLAKHDDLNDKDQTLTFEKVSPSIDIEKSNGKTPDAGNGNYTDKDNNVGVNDHDTEDTYFEVKPGATTKIFFRGTNNGTEPLTHLKVVDKTTNGSVNIKDMSFTFNNKPLTVNKEGEFELDGKLLVLQPKAFILGTGDLGALPAGELHGDKVTITGEGLYSKQKVGDDDKWHGKVEKAETPLQKIANIYLPKTGDSKSILAALGAWLITCSLLAALVLNERKRHTVRIGINQFKRHIKL